MGLDMYLEGKKYYGYSSRTVAPQVEEGFELKEKIFELGYWRKHPNLHGYIVQNFAGGVDECQKIELDIKNIAQILTAVKEDKLPPTSGFFFGTSREEDKDPTIETFEKALRWLMTEEEGVYRSVIYQASW